MMCLSRYLAGQPAADPTLRSDAAAGCYVGVMVFSAGFIAAAVYSSACTTVPRAFCGVDTFYPRLVAGLALLAPARRALRLGRIIQHGPPAGQTFRSDAPAG